MSKIRPPIHRPRARAAGLRFALPFLALCGCFGVDQPLANITATDQADCAYCSDVVRGFEQDGGVGTGNVKDERLCPAPDPCLPLTAVDGWNFPESVFERTRTPGTLYVSYSVSLPPHSIKTYEPNYYTSAFVTLRPPSDWTPVDGYADDPHSEWSGGFISSLIRRGAKRDGPLRDWHCRTCAEGEEAKAQVDAITGPTPSFVDNPRVETGWRGTMVDGQVAPDGTYTVFIEVTSAEFEHGALAMVLIDKGPTSSTFYNPRYVLPGTFLLPSPTTVTAIDPSFGIYDLLVEWVPEGTEMGATTTATQQPESTAEAASTDGDDSGSNTDNDTTAVQGTGTTAESGGRTTSTASTPSNDDTADLANDSEP